jgi:hypothetical protein
MAATIDGLKETGATWGDEIRGYETSKRRAVDEDLLKGPPLRVTHGFVKQQERSFDTILQRYREPRTELHQRCEEENARVAHLNRAQDVQILREQPYNVVTNESRIEPLHPGEPLRIGPQRPARKKYPDSFTDYNIVSTIPHSLHHWAEPQNRPQPAEKHARVREVPAFTVKDYDIITTKYLKEHEQKNSRDRELNLLEATSKHRVRNRFDPVTQQYNDAAEEERMRTFHDAHEVEMVERGMRQVPPTVKNRQAAFYNVVNHEVGNAGMLRWYDTAEDERKERYKNRYIVEHNLHNQDIKHDHIEHSRKLNRVSLQRFEEPIRRGYDILNNGRYEGRNGLGQYAPYPKEKPSVWERGQDGIERSASMPPGYRSATPARAYDSYQEQRALSRTPSVAGSEGRGGQSPMAESRRSRASSVARMTGLEAIEGAKATAPQCTSPTAAAMANLDVDIAPADLRRDDASAVGKRKGTPHNVDLTRPPRAPSSQPRAASVASSAPSRAPSGMGMAPPMRSASPVDYAPVQRRSASPGYDVGMSRFTPPPPRLPGSPTGSVYSKACH